MFNSAPLLYQMDASSHPLLHCGKHEPLQDMAGVLQRGQRGSRHLPLHVGHTDLCLSPLQPLTCPGDYKSVITPWELLPSYVRWGRSWKEFHPAALSQG